MIIVFQLLHCSILTVSQVAPFVFRVSLFVSFSLYFLVSGSFSHLCHISRAKGGRGMTRQLRLSFTCPPNTRNLMAGHSNKKDEIRIFVRSFWIQQDIYQGGTVLWSLPNCCSAATVVLGGYLLPSTYAKVWNEISNECTRKVATRERRVYLGCIPIFM